LIKKILFIIKDIIKMIKKPSIVWILILSCIFLLTIEKTNALGSQFGEGSKNKLKYRGIFNRQKNVDVSNLKVQNKTL
jgi:hypothetical protein